MKTTSFVKSLIAIAMLLCGGKAMAQQNIVNGVLVPNASAPAFGAVVDYNEFPQLTDVPSMYITVYKTTATPDGAGGYTYTYDTNQTMDVSTTKTDWYYQCRIVIADKNGNMKQRDELVGLRGRGNSTWNWVNSGKRPFRLKFPAKTDLLATTDANYNVVNEFAEEKNWTLLANAFDKTLIHNAFSYEIGHNKLTNLPFCPAYRFVDLYINKVYYGTYQVSDHVQVAKKRVNIAKDGWFVEMTGAGNGNVFLEDPYVTISNEWGNGTSGYANIKQPEDATSGTDTYNAMQASLSAYYKACITKSGYEDQVDIASLIDWTILEEISGNYDGTYGNVFHYREALNDKWHVGPVWDTDIAYGAHEGGTMSRSHIWDNGHEYEAMSNILRSLYSDPVFMKAYYERWAEIYDNGNLNTWVEEKIAELAKLVDKTQAKNFSIARPFGSSTFPISSADNMGGSYSSYADAISSFKSWTTDHIDWLNDEYVAQYDRLGCGSIGGGGTGGSGDKLSGDGYIAKVYDAQFTNNLFSIPASDIDKDAESIKISVTNGATEYIYLKYSVTGATSEWNGIVKEAISYTWGSNSGEYTITDAAEISNAKTYGINLLTSIGSAKIKVTCYGQNIKEVIPEPCSHDYSDYAQQTNGTYLRACSKCGEAEEGGDVYYQFTVYPESAETSTVMGTSWQPSDDKPNSIATVAVAQEIAETIPGWNIVSSKKNLEGNLTCKDLRIVDGHPYYSANKFVATSAIYTGRSVTAGEVGTVILPFKYQSASTDYADFYHFGVVEDDKISLVAIEPEIDGNASAYTPIIYKVKDGKSELIITGENITVKKSSADKSKSTVDGWSMWGTVEGNVSVSGDTLYQVSGDKVLKVANVTPAPFCAYISNVTGSKLAFYSLIFPSTTPMLKGDVNGDGTINVSDIVAMVNIILEISPMVPQADMDDSGIINVTDLRMLVDLTLEQK